MPVKFSGHTYRVAEDFTIATTELKPDRLRIDTDFHGMSDASSRVCGEVKGRIHSDAK
jgi:hypothetical protein